MTMNNGDNNCNGPTTILYFLTELQYSVRETAVHNTSWENHLLINHVNFYSIYIGHI